MRLVAALAAVLLAALVCAPVAYAADEGQKPAAGATDEKPRIDVVFCIDCSGSMGPVIEAAKQKVWAIVNEIAKARPSPELRIGLLGYGDHDRQHRIFPLSSDLDEVYKNLTTFRDERWGSEFVGLAVHKATAEMKWADGKQVLKVIYVVGNETARQGPPDFDYAKTAPEAIRRGIIVNAVYCGDVDYANATPTWREMAKLADGQYMEIARTGGAVIVATPYDKELNELSTKLNGTYVAYGGEGQVRAQNQAAQDANAAQQGATVGADRAVSKAGRQYNNGSWDLVDATREKSVELDKLKDEQLPEEMRKLTAEQRKEYVQKKAKERAEIQEQIRQVAAKRDAHVKEETAKKGLKDDTAFDRAVRDSIVKEAEKKGFTFEQ
jgi:hypothetical protein